MTSTLGARLLSTNLWRAVYLKTVLNQSMMLAGHFLESLAEVNLCFVVIAPVSWVAACLPAFNLNNVDLFLFIVMIMHFIKGYR